MLVSNLLRILPLLAAPIDAEATWWSPDTVPDTIRYGTIGKSIVHALNEGADRERVAAAFVVIEHFYVNSNEEEQTAIATGLLEAVVSTSERLECVNVIAPMLGESCREYVRGWNEFCGVEW